MKEQIAQIVKVWKPEVRKALVAGLLALAAWLLSYIGLDTDVTVAELVEALGAFIVTYLATWVVPNE